MKNIKKYIAFVFLLLLTMVVFGDRVYAEDDNIGTDGKTEVIIIYGSDDPNFQSDDAIDFFNGLYNDPTYSKYLYSAPNADGGVSTIDVISLQTFNTDYMGVMNCYSNFYEYSKSGYSSPADWCPDNGYDNTIYNYYDSELANYHVMSVAFTSIKSFYKYAEQTRQIKSVSGNEGSEYADCKEIGLSLYNSCRIPINRNFHFPIIVLRYGEEAVAFYGFDLSYAESYKSCIQHTESECNLSTDSLKGVQFTYYGSTEYGGNGVPSNQGGGGGSGNVGGIIQNGSDPFICSDVKYLTKAWLIIRIIAPFLAVLFGSLDLLKAVIASDEKKMKEAQGKLPKRVIIFVLLLLVPFVVQFVFGYIGTYGSDNMCLVKCVVTNNTSSKGCD